MINRPNDIALITRKLENNPGVALLGPRQVGKTTIAKIIQKNTDANVHYIDLESPDDVSAIKQDPIQFLNYYHDYLLIIDDVQFYPELFSILRPTIDQNNRNSRFLLLGSASPSLVRGVSESLAGRFSYYELTPIKLSHIEGNYTMKKHWLRGGYPRALLSSTDDICFAWYQDFIFSYVKRELSALCGININSQIALRLWQMLAARSGSLHNASDLSRSIGTSVTTINRYINYLEGAYLILVLSPWFVNVNKRLTKSPKIYIKDTGILHSLLGLRSFDHMLNSPSLGSSWETYVINQITSELDLATQAFYYRTQQGAEIDLLLVRDGASIAAIEIKYSNSPKISRGFYNSIDDIKTSKNYVITPSTSTYPVNNLIVTNLSNFIQEILPKLLNNPHD